MAEERNTVDERDGQKQSLGPEAEPEKQALSELELENKRLREENERLKEYRASLPPKERMYDHVPLTVKQMDILIGCLLTVLVIVVVMGLLDR